MLNANQIAIVGAHLKEILKFLYDLIQIDKDERRSCASKQVLFDAARKQVRKSFRDCSEVFCLQYRAAGC